MTAKVELIVPEHRLSCSTWLRAQPPDLIADCLDLSQCAHNALVREVGKGEASKLSKEVSSLKAQLLKAEQEAKESTDRAVLASQKKAAAFLEAQKQVWAEELSKEQLDKEARVAALKSREDTLKNAFETCESEASQRELALRKRLAAQEDAQEKVLEAERSRLLLEHKKALDKDRAAQKLDLVALEERCARVSAELQQVEQRHSLRLAEEKELLKDIAAQQLEQLRQEKSQELAAKTQAFEQQAEAAGKYWAEVQKLNLEIRELCQKHSEELLRLKDEHGQHTKELYTERESLAEKYLSTFRGSTASVGQVGEDFVARVQSELSLGTWIDTSHTAAPGCSDALWEMDFPNCCKLSALVEIKHTQRLHSVHDIKKFSDDVSEAARQGKINCAVLISLATRIQNTRPLHLSFEHGVAVLKASRSADDALPARSLVELALTTLATAWPLVQRRRGERPDESIFCSISELFDSQLTEVTKLSKQADELDKNGRSLQRLAVQLRKTRDALAKGVDTVRIQFPQLVTAEEEQDEEGNLWAEPPALALLDAIQQFKLARHGHYPKSFKELTGSLSPEVRAFVEAQSVDIKDAVARAKTLVPKGPKRARLAEDEEASAAAAVSTPQGTAAQS
jgi:hypothetical protein